MSDLGPVAWAVLVVATLLIGFSKTSVGGLGLISVAAFAAVLPSRASTGVVLPLLILGDVLAVRAYRRHTDWPTLLRLLPAVAVGLGLGVAFLARVDDAGVRRAIGVMLLGLVALHLVTARRARRGTGDGPPDDGADQQGPSRVAAGGYGTLAGFTTMVANAGGPAMSLYLLSARFSMMGFIGTSAWFFFSVNLLKVPLSVGLGLITPSSLLLNAVLAPAVLAGAWVGRRVVGRVDQVLFERLVLATTVLAALNLVR